MGIFYVCISKRIDCCHCGTGLDLPYTYDYTGNLVSYSPKRILTQGITSIGTGILIINISFHV